MSKPNSPHPILPHHLTGPKIFLPKLGLNQQIPVQWGTSLTWVKAYLDELNSNLDEEDRQIVQDPGDLTIDLVLEKKLEGSSGNQENIIAEGTIDARFYNLCARCLIPVKQEVHLDINACFVPEAAMNEVDSEYQDQTTVYAHDKELDLYSYKKSEIDLLEFVREQFFLFLDLIPLHAEDCKGLCQVCGIDLNKETCGHKQPTLPESEES